MLEWSHLVIIILSILVFLLVILYLKLKKKHQGEYKSNFEQFAQSLKSEILSTQLDTASRFHDSLNSTSMMIDRKLSEGNENFNRKMHLFGEIHHKLGELEEQSRKMERVGENIQSLAELLKPPQTRGKIGELLLENLLSQILPRKLFEMQYQFTSGQRVDAIVRIADSLIPIDSKFPMESFQRLYKSDNREAAENDFFKVIKKHINDISKKYIKPDEKTTEFAMMYIPAEAVYFELISGKNQSWLEYALSQNIIPTSPGHLYAFLASISSLYQQLGISNNKNGLSQAVKSIGSSLKKLLEFQSKIEGSMRNISLNLQKSNSETNEMISSLNKLKGGSAEAGADKEISGSDELVELQEANEE